MLAFLKSLPTIISLIKEVIGLFKEYSDFVEKQRKAKELKEAVAHAKKTKDTSKLEEYFNPTSNVNSNNGTKPMSKSKAKVDS